MQNYILSATSTADLSKEHFESRGIPYLCFHFMMDDVEHIDDLFAVYGKQRIADTDAVPQRASVFNFGNHITHLDSFKQKEERDNLSSLSVSITLLPSEPDGHCTYRKPCRHDEAF